MTKKYQTEEFDTSKLAVPGQVSIAMDQIAADMREGLLALAVGAGLQVMGGVDGGRRGHSVRAEGQARPGPGRDPARHGTARHGTEAGSVTLGGRRVPVPAYELFNSTELLGRMALERMLAGVSTRRYPAALEPVGDQVTAEARSTSRSAVSRKFVAMTETALADMLAADLTDLDLVALMIDGVHFADHLCVVALGIDIDGVKHPLALVQGSTENTTLVRALLVGLRERALDVTKGDPGRPGRRQGAGRGGQGGLRPASDRSVCQIHKLRNVADHLPEKMRGPVTKRMRTAYQPDSALQAEALLEALAKELDKTHPGAAGSLREGMAETLTVLRLEVPPTLARTLRSTNAIESMISISRDHARNVKRCRDGQMTLRWCAAGMVEASKQFRRVNGHLHLAALRTALEPHVGTETVGTDCNTQDVSAA